MASEVSPKRQAGDSVPAVRATVDSPNQFHLPGWLFAYAAVVLFAFLIVLEASWVVRVTYGPARAIRSTAEALGWLWPWLTLGLLVWGVVNLASGLTALRDGRVASAFAHLGLLLCCGVAVIGLQALGAARTLTSRPIVLDYSNLGGGPFSKNSGGAPAAAPAAVGDPVEGKKLFAMTCVTCHGSGGDGLNNLAPSLRASEFIKSADVAAITRVVKRGRAITDPANKSGKMMPAKGGNPFLTDGQIAHLVAFIQTLPGSAAAAPPTSNGAGQPAAQLARWVLPPAAAPPEGFIDLSSDRDLIGWAGYERIATDRQQASLQSLGMSAVAVHGLFLLGLVGVSMHLVFGWLLHVPTAGARSWLTLIAAGWLVALAAWLLVMWLFPGQ